MKKQIILVGMLSITFCTFTMTLPDNDQKNHYQVWNEHYVQGKQGKYVWQEKNPGINNNDESTYPKPQFPFTAQQSYCDTLEETTPTDPLNAHHKDYVRATQSLEEILTNLSEPDRLKAQIERAAMGYAKEPYIEHLISHRNQYHNVTALELLDNPTISNFYENKKLIYDPQVPFDIIENQKVIGQLKLPVLRYEEKTYPLHLPIENSDGRVDLSLIEGTRQVLRCKNLEQDHIYFDNTCRALLKKLQWYKKVTTALAISTFTTTALACYLKFFGKK